MTSVRCARCGETVDVEDADSTRCPNCSAELHVTIDLETGRIVAVRVALVVDDDALARRLARQALEKEGYAVVEASNGPDGALAAGEHLPSLALVDEAMPAMSGEHAARLLRRTSPDVVIVAFTDGNRGLPEWADAAVAKDGLDRLPSLVSLLNG